MTELELYDLNTLEWYFYDETKTLFKSSLENFKAQKAQYCRNDLYKTNDYRETKHTFSFKNVD